MARWVFDFQRAVFNGLSLLAIANCPSGAGGEVANAQVCKTCIRGFNSRPALQFQLQAKQDSSNDDEPYFSNAYGHAHPGR
jgi:hypothetical protein